MYYDFLFHYEASLLWIVICKIKKKTNRNISETLIENEGTFQNLKDTWEMSAKLGQRPPGSRNPAWRMQSATTVPDPTAARPFIRWTPHCRLSTRPLDMQGSEGERDLPRQILNPCGFSDKMENGYTMRENYIRIQEVSSLSPPNIMMVNGHFCI
jgi:hypothetical protein